MLPAAHRALRCAVVIAIACDVPLVASCGGSGGYTAPFNIDAGWGIVGSGAGGGGLLSGDGGYRFDAGGPQDSGNSSDGAHSDSEADANMISLEDGGPPDSETPMDSGPPSDTGSDTGMGGGSRGEMDSGSGMDTGNGTDGGGGVDSGKGTDGGQGSDSGADAGSPSDASAGDGGSTVGISFSIPPGLFPTLTWTISGPATYSGVLHMGDAHSIEFVVGGIEQGDGYTLTLSGTDRYGGMCSGTSAPFNVQAGMVSQAGVVIDCPDPEGGSGAEAANVTTGSVGANASVVIGSE
jgi:hypothetical protein